MIFVIFRDVRGLCFRIWSCEGGVPGASTQVRSLRIPEGCPALEGALHKLAHPLAGYASIEVQASFPAVDGLSIRHRMKRFFPMVRFVIFAGLATSSAIEDSAAHSSPDGSITVRNIGDSAAPDHHFQIVGRRGEVLLSSAKHPDLESGSFAESLVWAPDGHNVAFGVRTTAPHNVPRSPRSGHS